MAVTDFLHISERFSIPGILTFNKQENDFIFITVSNPHANARICLYGAQILSFCNKNNSEILWMSPLSNFSRGKAIRGGIPVCFPWFGPDTTQKGMPQHGFGRLMVWEISETTQQTSGETKIILRLDSSENTRAYWPHDFTAEIIILVGQTLKVTLKVTNVSERQFEYSCALHSYFKISGIDDIKIEGLEGAEYYENDKPGKFIQTTSNLEIHGIVDRHYYNTQTTCIIDDPNNKRKIYADKSGSKVTTVWNPWSDNCLKMSDMPDNAYTDFVCVEAVNSFDDTILLNPGECHEITALIRTEV